MQQIFGIIMLMTELKYQRLVSAVPLFQRYEGRGFLHFFIGMLIVGTSTFGLVIGIITALEWSIEYCDYFISIEIFMMIL